MYQQSTQVTTASLEPTLADRTLKRHRNTKSHSSLARPLYPSVPYACYSDRSNKAPKNITTSSVARLSAGMLAAPLLHVMKALNVPLLSVEH